MLQDFPPKIKRKAYFTPALITTWLHL